MALPCDTFKQRGILWGAPLTSVALGLILTLGGFILTGCDKIKIPEIGGTATPAPVAPVVATPSAAPAATQQPVTPPVVMETPKTESRASVKLFLEKAQLAGNIEDADLTNVVEAKEGLDKVEKLILPGAKITDKGLAVLSKFPRLISVDISTTAVTNEGLKVFKEMPLLKSLGLAGTKITDVGLNVIAEHPGLKELNLAKTPVTDIGLALLGKLEYLEVLDISYTSITGAGFEKFRGNKKLRVLYAQHSSIHPEAFKFLKGAPMEDLNLDVTGTNDLAMLTIGSYKKLKHLRLEFCGGISDLGMSKLSGMKDLETLSVRNVSNLTSRILNPIKPCKKLKLLNINGTLISDSDALAFQKMIGPELKIVK
ncbi:MAG: F-box/LRR-repeat protein 20 [Planctomycetaceae bacterium]|nr:F-box/LRR-repeat protein 20 [Planctomycetaceae bacterium]